MKLLRDLFLLVGLLFSMLVPAWGEVSVEQLGIKYSGFILLGGGDDPFPWPIIRAHLIPAHFLNPSGNENGDGLPAFAIDPVTGFPEVVWAWNDGNDHEIVYSRWDGVQWTVMELLTNNGANDLDPAITIHSDGMRRITWWRAGNPAHVWYLEKPAPGPWSGEERVTAVVEQGSRPGIAFSSGPVRVAFQAPGPSETEVAVSERLGSWEKQIIATTAYQGPAGNGDIDVQIHAQGSRCWVDWVHGEGTMGYAVFSAGNWGTPQFEPYSPSGGDSETTAREMARVRIRNVVLR